MNIAEIAKHAESTRKYLTELDSILERSRAPQIITDHNENLIPSTECVFWKEKLALSEGKAGKLEKAYENLLEELRLEKQRSNDWRLKYICLLEQFSKLREPLQDQETHAAKKSDEDGNDVEIITIIAGTPNLEDGITQSMPKENAGEQSFLSDSQTIPSTPLKQRSSENSFRSQTSLNRRADITSDINPEKRKKSAHHASKSISEAVSEDPKVIRPERLLHETVRNKAERRKMIGTTCACCVGFHDTMQQMTGATKSETNQRIQHASRHRLFQKPDLDPPHLWDVGIWTY